MAKANTTAEEAAENAARLLRNREAGLTRTHGSTNTETISLATAWTELARVMVAVNKMAKEED